MTDPENSPIKGWVLYDGTCGFCSRWVPFWESTLKKRGFLIAPLQAGWVAGKFALTEQELASDFRLLLAKGDKLVARSLSVLDATHLVDNAAVLSFDPPDLAKTV